MNIETFVNISDDIKKIYGMTVPEAAAALDKAAEMTNPFARLPVVFTKKDMRAIRRMVRKYRRAG